MCMLSRSRDFDPQMHYPPSVLYLHGADYELQAQGIYYRQDYSEDLVLCDRKVWTPSLPEEEEQETPEMVDQQTRARIFAEHSKNNEKWCKSEYAWEADAWSDVFRPMRDDPCLAM
jgi:hypothetical protein